MTFILLFTLELLFVVCKFWSPPRDLHKARNIVCWQPYTTPVNAALLPPIVHISPLETLLGVIEYILSHPMKKLLFVRRKTSCLYKV